MTTIDAGPPRCTCCGRERRERTNRPGTCAGARGWCGACYRRWCLDGKPAEGPPPPMVPLWRNAIVNQRRVLEAQWRRAEFARLRSAGYTISQAATVLGVTYRAGWNYERKLASSQPAAASAA